MFLIGISSSLGKGSTNLHLDVSDAVNVLAYVAAGREGKEESSVGKSIICKYEGLSHYSYAN